jgi:hypothetical protein
VRNIYELNSGWALTETADAVWDALEALLGTDDPFPWWPSVRVVAGDGSALDVEARSIFGYAVRFRLYDLVRRPPRFLTFASDGDLRGHGSVTLRPVNASSCLVDIQWNVSVDRTWMRASSWLLRPVFVIGHHVLMRQGEKNFSRWLAAQPRT